MKEVSLRKSEFAVVAFALFLFFLVGPLTAKREGRQKQEVKQEQVAEPADEIFDDGAGEKYHVLYRATGMKENAVADILWLKKAAEIAMDAGIPHFNVRKKKMTKEFNRKVHRRMNVVEGVIELDNDPMEAEYDANEIMSLVLPELNP
jgi:hypothetical protein